MPKFRPNTAVGKRVKITGTGKLVSQHSGMRHNLEVKSSRRTRRLAGTVELRRVDVKRLNKMLGR